MRFLIFFIAFVFLFSYDLIIFNKIDKNKLENMGFLCNKKDKYYVCLSSDDIEGIKKIQSLLRKFSINSIILPNRSTKQNKQYNRNFCIQIMSFKNFNNAKRAFLLYKNYSFARLENINGFYTLRIGEGSYKEIIHLKSKIKKGIVRKCKIVPKRIIFSNFKIKN